MIDSSPKQEPPYGLRMPPDLKGRVKAAAEASGRSMNAEIVATLEEKYPAPPAAPVDRAIEIAEEMFQIARAMADKNMNTLEMAIGLTKIKELEDEFRKLQESSPFLRALGDQTMTSSLTTPKQPPKYELSRGNPDDSDVTPSRGRSID